MKTKRQYVMRARADSTAQTRQRILQAMFDLHEEKFSVGIALDDVASRAGVSVQTVLRHFGSRDNLIEATIEFASELIGQERQAPAGDLAAAVRTIFDHYELRGDSSLMLLAQEFTEPWARRVTDNGRKVHREWVKEVFAPQLDQRAAARAEVLTDLLVVATDVYTWKLLRRDRGLSRRLAEQRVRQLVDGVLAADPEGTPNE
ncbi:TetR/AcrR family transcriptional regulator [Micromonospora sp. NBC_01813]|uniref:TetR/AcrR family transcriptional regulator n=1 Tax=Micromonospora sp. NBC_01813 TaxID=2975988 RepID=UPI002DDC54A1|nr:TetR/AcrR family transcriptional regulator [Micromonospora sp. NBC_01813]WSA12038.1 TetR/AcrR family transcriptional regulator [Micromonospora sp. NBC_01813]